MGLFCPPPSCNVRTVFEVILRARGKPVGNSSDRNAFLVRNPDELTAATKTINAYAIYNFFRNLITEINIYYIFSDILPKNSDERFQKIEKNKNISRFQKCFLFLNFQIVDSAVQNLKNLKI